MLVNRYFNAPRSRIEYSPAEEMANRITHGFGAAASLAGTIVLIVVAALNGSAWQAVSFSIYGASLIFLYAASTLYHSVRQPRLKHLFRIVDHAAIFALIAGTYTPFLLLNLRGGWGWSLFGIIWGLALLGIGFKAFHIRRLPKISVVFYVAMGWLCVIAMQEMLTQIPLGALIWLGAGGVCYTGGIIFYGWKRLPYNHAIWHLFVLGGSACHYFAILLYLSPSP